MEFIRYDRPNEFAALAEPILSKQEDLYSLFLGVMRAVQDGRYTDPFQAAIFENGQVLALIQMTPPHPLHIVIVQETQLDAILDKLIENLQAFHVKFTSIISLKPWANRFAEKWQEMKGTDYKQLMDQGLYRLDTVNSLDNSPGNWRLANEKDSPLIEKWFTLFEEDAKLPISPLEEVKKRVSAFITEREVFVWEHEGKAVSMMKKARPTNRGITVSLVFTPKEERRKGYARTLVAAISKELLTEYDFCVLYTDLLNPTSNKIYKEIGYQQIANSVCIEFK